MPLLDLISSSWLGTLLGMRHALEPDHLAALSTLVSRERSGTRAALLGAWWGLGHTLTLLVVGSVLLVLRAEMPPGSADVFEFAVALLLIGLGLRAIMQAARQGAAGPTRVHTHGRLVHSHPVGPPHVHIGTWTFARRPLVIGALHGLAGSGALTALVLSTLPSLSARLVYVALFGLGSTLSMAVVSGLLGWPLAHLGRHQLVVRGLTLAVGCVSVAIGLWWGSTAFGRLL